MDSLPVATDLERRKRVRLRLRSDLEVTPQFHEGSTFYVVKDPVGLRYYRFPEADHFLLKLLDGSHTMEEVREAFEQHFRPQRLTLEDLEAFAQTLLQAGLAYHELPQAGRQMYERGRKRRRGELLQLVTNILYIPIPLFDPDPLLGILLRRLRWLFAPWFLMAGTAVILAALFLVASHFETFWARLPSAQEFFRFQNLLYLWVALGIVKVIHELAHGLTCKVLGGEVHDMGALLLCMTPCLYVNVSDAWTIPDRWKRMVIGLAGVFIELLIAALSTFIWWNTEQPFVHNLCQSLMIVCSFNTLLFNGNPLLRYDGYYLLADWLEIPNLRERCNAYLKRLMMRHCLGMDVLPEPPMALRRRVLFVLYAVASYIYGWFITFAVLWSVGNFLPPKLAIVSRIMACAAIGSMGPALSDAPRRTANARRLPVSSACKRRPYSGWSCAPRGQALSWERPGERKSASSGKRTRLWHFAASAIQHGCACSCRSRPMTISCSRRIRGLDATCRRPSAFRAGAATPGWAKSACCRRVRRKMSHSL